MTALLDKPARVLPQAQVRDQHEMDQRVAEYLSLRQPALLELIIAEHVPFVRAICAKLSNPVKNILDTEDLIQSGLVGLLASVNKYDIARGVSFRSFAFQRIRGAVVDAIRAASSTSRYRNVTYVQLKDVYAVGEDTEMADSGLSPKASQVLRTTLLELPMRKALVLLLALNGLPTSQIARLLSVSDSQVHQDKQQAMASMRTTLTSQLGEYL